MIRLPTDRTLTIPNRLCAYCIRELTTKTRTRDHVVARKFVPQGTLVDSCNIGVWACKDCNGHKAKLEDDISAITMMPNPNGKFARDDPRLIKTAQRKAKGAISSVTKKHVAKSYPELGVNMPFGNANFKFNFTAHPIIDDKRAARLAWSQIQGIWFYQTFNKERGTGKFLPPDKFAFDSVVSRADWGNERITAFASQTKDWEHQLHAILADGYFCASVKASSDKETLAWSVEWNEAYRVYGYWSMTDSWEKHANVLPQLVADFSHGDTINGFAYRTEVALNEEDDILFAEPPNFDDLPEHDVRK